MVATLEYKQIDRPDERQTYPNGQVEVVQMAGGRIRRGTFQPGWRWSKDVGPIVGTTFCEAPHFLYQIAGRMAVQLADGTEVEYGPGTVVSIPASRHDAWVVGDEAVVSIDWSGAVVDR